MATTRKRKIASLEAQLAKLRKEEDDAKGRKYVVCGKCGKKSQIRTVTYVQTYWYEGPHG